MSTYRSYDELLDAQSDWSDEAADELLWEKHQDHDEFDEDCEFCVMGREAEAA